MGWEAHRVRVPLGHACGQSRRPVTRTAEPPRSTPRALRGRHRTADLDEETLAARAWVRTIGSLSK